MTTAAKTLEYMTYESLTKLAARALGYTLEDHYDAHGEYFPWCIELSDNWCPAWDSRDNFELMVNLEVSVSCDKVLSWSWTSDKNGLRLIAVKHDDAVEYDAEHATRLAILRTAALYGMRMKPSCASHSLALQCPP
jgi:hypothetical protein